MEYTNDDLLNYIENDFKKNPNAFKSGRRNDDAVDLSIMCHCVDMNAFKLIDEMRIIHKWDEIRYELTMEHMERVKPYLEKWGKGGTMEAMIFCLNY